jgi:hypothetical protein
VEKNMAMMTRWVWRKPNKKKSRLEICQGASDGA